MKLKSKTKTKNAFKKWLDKITQKARTQAEIIDSPWPEYEELSLLPLDELEEMVEKEAAKEAEMIAEKTQKILESEHSALESHVSKEIKPQDPHIADLRNNYPNPPLIQCYTADGDGGDPNLRITHYPPSNSLH